ncbi:MAG: hypothetical protein IKE16_11195 [Solobacterium sp.]|nr:hypothetical protein [Solobacterium sp.]MBR2795200.1 hypothetical protein [Solobacterium sp.]
MTVLNKKEEMTAEKTMLTEDDLNEVSGGKTYKIKENKWLFCPYCMSHHNISVMAGKHRVGAYMHTLYRCNRKGQMFIKATNGYFDMNDERLYTGSVKQ